MNKFMIESREDLYTLQSIFEKNDISTRLSHLFDEHGNQIGSTLEVFDKIYFWSLGKENDNV